MFLNINQGETQIGQRIKEEESLTFAQMQEATGAI